MMFDQICGRLEGVRPYKPSTAAISKAIRSQCPSCGGSTTKLNASLKSDGNILLFCHGGCDVSSILNSIGLTVSDLFSESYQPGAVHKRTATLIKGWEWWSIVSALDNLAQELTVLFTQLTEHFPVDDPARIEVARAVGCIKQLSESYRNGKGAK